MNANLEQPHNLCKTLTVSLKDSFENVMKAGADRITHEASGKTTEDARCGLALEKFLSDCNQLELNLKAISACVLQSNGSTRHLPYGVALGNQDTAPSSVPDGTLTYPALTRAAREQIKHCNDINNILTQKK